MKLIFDSIPPKNTDVISVNRIDFESQTSLAELDTLNAKSIRKGIFGWHAFTVVDAEEVGCYVKASPLVGNPNHAHIVFPVVPKEEESKVKLTEIACDLAHHANFLL